MSWLGQAPTVFWMAIRRLWHHRGLAVSMLFGLVAAVSISVSVPTFAELVSARVLQDRLGAGSEQNAASPFSFLLRYVGSWQGYLEWEDCSQIDHYVRDLAAATIGLPERWVGRHFRTDQLFLLPSQGSAYVDADESLSFVTLGFMADVESHITILDGQYPRPPADAEEPLQVLVSNSLVGRLGIGVGEDYVVYHESMGRTVDGSPRAFHRRVRIAGTWEPSDAGEPFWFYPPSALDDVLLIPEQSYVWLAQEVKGEVDVAAWYLVCDSALVRPTTVGRLMAGIANLNKEAKGYLRGVELAQSPEQALREYQDIIRTLTVALVAFGVPTVALIAYFCSLVAGSLAQRQRNEAAMLRGRGATVMQMAWVSLVELLVLALVAAALGLVLGERGARLMMAMRSFLITRHGLWQTLLLLLGEPVKVSVFSWPQAVAGVGVLAVTLAAVVVPIVQASRETIVSYKRERSRSWQAPLWQRLYLDLFLLLPALYGVFRLQRRGTIGFMEADANTGSPFSNPTLFAVPVLLIFGLALLFLRLVPHLLAVLAWLAGWFRGPVPVLVFRYLARMSGQYLKPMMLIVLTLSLAVFTASMARTLDEHALAAVYYQVGADYRLVETGESADSVDAEASGEQEEAGGEPGPSWYFLPVVEHESIPGVRHATRVWNQDVRVEWAGQNQPARLVGIDRVDFPKVAFFRRDFAPASLGALMNALAVRNDAMLVSRQLATDYSIEVGDRLEVTIPVGSAPRLDFRVAGVVDYFPTCYPEEGPFVVANLDYCFDSVGGLFPYDVWLATEAAALPAAVLGGTEALGIRVLGLDGARREVEALELRPERQGVLGLMSIGFLASAFLAVLGYLISTYLSFSQRYIELGVLRAIGLTVRQLALFLVIEQMSIIGAGLLVGTGLGLLASQAILPFYHVSVNRYPLTPPLMVHMAWTDISYIYAIFGAMFVIAIAVLLVAVRRLRVFEAIKLGETT